MYPLISLLWIRNFNLFKISDSDSIRIRIEMKNPATFTFIFFSPQFTIDKFIFYTQTLPSHRTRRRDCFFLLLFSFIELFRYRIFILSSQIELNSSSSRSTAKCTYTVGITNPLTIRRGIQKLTVYILMVMAESY